MTELDMCVRVVVGAGFGFAIGLERESLNKPAGVRTHCIVSAAAALLTTSSLLIGDKLNVPGEALRVAAGVVTGIGFIGAGTILQTKRTVTGLTTAATVFMAAAIGIAVGGGLYYLALSAAAITISAAWALRGVDQVVGNDQRARQDESPSRVRKIARRGSPRHDASDS